MGFSSVIFIFFFLPLLMAVFLLSKKFIQNENFENFLLIIFSIIFYIWGANLLDIKILFLIIVFNYLISIINRQKQKKWILFLGILFNVFVLVYFKYLSKIFNLLFLSGIKNKEIVFPLGLSFIIFHCISYLVDSSKERIVAKNELTNVLDFLLYILYFPKLIQGPIVQFKDMSRNIHNKNISYNNIIYGVERIIIGLGKKVLIADELGKTLSSIYYNGNFDNLTAWLVVIGYSLQLYLDFSGYSDIAIGISNIFGIKIKENFNFPYLSKSLTEFWKRWHISLGNWFKNYVYIPLGGNRTGNLYLNLSVVFLLTGLWHGNTQVYLYWGIYHGLFILVEKYIHSKQILTSNNKYINVIRILYTNIVVSIGWLCFQFDSIQKIFNIIKQMLWIIKVDNVGFTWKYYFSTKIIALIAFSWIMIVFLDSKHFRRFKVKFENQLWFSICKYLLLILIFLFSLSGIISNQFSPFLYFQY